MSDIPAELAYTAEHEWLRGEGPATVGITAHAVSELGDIVFIELPELGKVYSAGEPCGEIESTKAVSEIYAPVGGEIVEINEAMVTAPESLADDPYGDGWLFKIQSDGGDYELLDAAAYEALIAD